LAPFGQRDFAVLLEPIAGVEMSIKVEVVVNGRMDGDELLETSPSLAHTVEQVPMTSKTVETRVS